MLRIVAARKRFVDVPDLAKSYPAILFTQRATLIASCDKPRHGYPLNRVLKAIAAEPQFETGWCGLGEGPPDAFAVVARRQLMGFR